MNLASWLGLAVNLGHAVGSWLQARHWRIVDGVVVDERGLPVPVDEVARAARESLEQPEIIDVGQADIIDAE